MNNYQKFYDELNKEQRSAVDTIDGPLLIIAGPGTGKTQLLSVRASAILKKAKAQPENILILTYTNSAAKSMKERLAKIIGPEGYEVEVCTFHSFANLLLQQSEEAADYIGDKIQMSDVEQVRAIQYILDHTRDLSEVRPVRAPYLYLSEILKRISELKRDGIKPKDFAEKLKETKTAASLSADEKYAKRLKALAIIYSRYEELKEGKDKEAFDERGRYDFDDMILFATEALKKDASLLKKYRDRFKYVMVDEYQDSNGSQLELLFTLLDSKSPNLCCVGDDDQSIYRFQGASVGNFSILEKRFSGLKTIELKNNYRSPTELIQISSQVIKMIPIGERVSDKSLHAASKAKEKEIEFEEFSTENEEIIFLIDKIKDLKRRIEKDTSLPREERTRPYNNIAVLLRKRSEILKLIDAFLRAGIPYATDGKEDISGEKRVKQLLDVLELAYIDPRECETKDLILYKVLTADYLEIPQADILAFINHVNRAKHSPERSRPHLLEEFLNYFSSGKDGIHLKERVKLVRAAEAIHKLLADSRTKPLHMLLINFIKDAGLYSFILKEYSGNSVLRIRELRALTSFINMVKTSDVANPSIRLDEFMAEIKTRKDQGLPLRGELATLTQDGVRLFTAHGAKGLEFHSVIIPFCLQNKNWPLKPFPDKLPLPSAIFVGRRDVADKDVAKKLALYDEMRLFYVAMTRAKSNLIFTASPREDIISSSFLSNIGIDKKFGSMTEEDIFKKSLAITETEDPFIGTEAVLRDLVKDLTLNPTRLNTYMSCRRKFLYNDVLRLPGSKKRGLVFGNCVHKALEDVYNAYRREKRFPSFEFFRSAFERELKFQGVDREMERQCLNPDQMNKLKGWYMHASKEAVMPISLEKKLLINVGSGIIFTGKYDKLEWDDEKRNLVKIVDYKTGKPDNHLKGIEITSDVADSNCDGYFRQLVAYKLLFEKDRSESKGQAVNRASLVFIEPVASDIKKLGYKKGDYATKTVEISDSMTERLEKLIIEIWNNIVSLKFEKPKERDPEKCNNCDFDTICWSRR